MGGRERHRQNLSIDLRYEHAFLQASATPPFELRYFSAPFMFPRLYKTDVDFVQFCAGLAFGDNTSELTYGIGDCGLRLDAKTHAAALCKRKWHPGQ